MLCLVAGGRVVGGDVVEEEDPEGDDLPGGGHTCIYIYIYIYATYTHVYVDIEIDIDIDIDIAIYMYVYIYIEREIYRER